MGKTSRDKGAAYERELVRDARGFGFRADRTAALQANGAMQGSHADVAILDLPDVHLEAKRDERKSVDAMVRQAEEQAPPGSLAVVVYRRNRQPSRVVFAWRAFLEREREVADLRAEVDSLRWQLAEATA